MSEETKKEDLDPRQTAFLAYYLNPKSGTFSNALQSALKAGYSQEYSESITTQMPEWLAENLGRSRMLNSAEKNLIEFLEMDTNNVGRTVKGDEFDFNDPRLVGIKADITKFVVSRLNKSKWAERTEFTGKDGEKLILQISQEIAEKNNLNANDINSGTIDNSTGQAQV